MLPVADHNSLYIVTNYCVASTTMTDTNYGLGNSKGNQVQTNADAQSDQDIEATDRECIGSCFAYSCYCCTYCLACIAGRNTEDVDGPN